MGKIYDIVVRTSTYKNADGEEKGRYVTIGAVFESEDGRKSMKLETVPTGNWNGWANFYPPKPKSQVIVAQAVPERAPAQPKPEPDPAGADEENLPF